MIKSRCVYLSFAPFWKGFEVECIQVLTSLSSCSFSLPLLVCVLICYGLLLGHPALSFSLFIWLMGFYSKHLIVIMVSPWAKPLLGLRVYRMKSKLLSPSFQRLLRYNLSLPPPLPTGTLVQQRQTGHSAVQSSNICWVPAMHLTLGTMWNNQVWPHRCLPFCESNNFK